MTYLFELPRLWISLTSASLAFIVNVGFYCFFLWRRSLSQNIHWFLCNFVISELIRAATTVVDSVRWRMQLIEDNEWNNTFENRNESVLTEIQRMQLREPFMLAVLNIAKPALKQVIATCMMTTCIFGLLILIQFYYYLKSAQINDKERFDAKSIALVTCVWIGSTAYVVFVTVLNMIYYEEDMIPYNYDAIVSTILTSIYLLCSLLLAYFTYRLRYVVRIELYCLSNSVAFDEASMEAIYKIRRRGVRFLLIFTLALFVPVSCIWFLSIWHFIDYFRPHFMVRRCVEQFASVYTFIFGSIWLFVWVRLDLDIGQEINRKFRTWTKFPPRLDSASLKYEQRLKCDTATDGRVLSLQHLSFTSLKTVE